MLISLYLFSNTLYEASFLLLSVTAFILFGYVFYYKKHLIFSRINGIPKNLADMSNYLLHNYIDNFFIKTGTIVSIISIMLSLFFLIIPKLNNNYIISIIWLLFCSNILHKIKKTKAQSIELVDNVVKAENGFNTLISNNKYERQLEQDNLIYYLENKFNIYTNSLTQKHKKIEIAIISIFVVTISISLYNKYNYYFINHGYQEKVALNNQNENIMPSSEFNLDKKLEQEEELKLKKISEPNPVAINEKKTKEDAPSGGLFKNQELENIKNIPESPLSTIKISHKDGDIENKATQNVNESKINKTRKPSKIMHQETPKWLLE